MWSHPESLETPIPFQGNLRSGFLSVTDSMLEVLHKPKACSRGPVPQLIKCIPLKRGRCSGVTKGHRPAVKIMFI